MKDEDYTRKYAPPEYYKEQEELARKLLENMATPTKKKYYMVMVEPDTAPLAMFTEKVWAEEWQFKYCRTAIIEEFDLALLAAKK